MLTRIIQAFFWTFGKKLKAKKLKTQGKNSKLMVKTGKVGTFRIPGTRKSVQKKPELTTTVETYLTFTAH